jgi:exodeoxyribonuclease VII large subunit
MTSVPEFTVSDFVAVTNQTLEYAYPVVHIVGEVSSFKVNQNKFVFFDLKDEESSVGCFMMLFALRVPLEDGMKVVVFSLTVQQVHPVGEGSIKRGFELLKAKLEKEGLFASERKRPIVEMPERVAVISSTGAAGYGDFVKIINERWGGLKIDVAQVQVQGAVAADQIIAALAYFNEQTEQYDALLILRGGGSADDLAVFNDEALVRAIARSRIPTMTGIGHEQDVTLVDLAADVRASTPSNAAQLLVPDSRYIVGTIDLRLQRTLETLSTTLADTTGQIEHKIGSAIDVIVNIHGRLSHELELLERSARQLNPNAVLQRGYSIVRAENNTPLKEVATGDMLQITTTNSIIKSEVVHVKER